MTNLSTEDRGEDGYQKQKDGAPDRSEETLSGSTFSDRLRQNTTRLPDRRDTLLETLRSLHFLDPSGCNYDRARELVEAALSSLVKNQGVHPLYPRSSDRTPPTEIVRNYEIPASPASSPLRALERLHELLGDSVRGGHPLMVKNIIPAPSLVGLAAFFAASTLEGNAVTEEDAGHALLSEIACVAGVSRLVGIDPVRSGGVFVSGGTGTNLYGIKMGLAKAIPDHRERGLHDNPIIVGSQLSHYCHAACTDWLGLGSQNYWRAKSLPDQSVDLGDVERLCRMALDSQRPLGCIVVNAGTTSCLGIDDLRGACELAERLQKEYALPYKPHVHADSVLGWAFAVFRNYNYEENPLNLSEKAKDVIANIVHRLEGLKAVDSFGVDFHKLGFVAYSSSMVVARDCADLERLSRNSKDIAPLFNSTSAYNPGLFTLETTRSTANIVATRLALESIGIEGYQALLGNLVENGIVIRDEFDTRGAEHGLIAINRNRYAPDTAVRAYPEGVNAQAALATEMISDQANRDYEDYFARFATWVDQEFSRRPDGVPMTRSKAAIFNEVGVPLGGLRIYPISPYMTTSDARTIVDFVIRAKQTFDAREKSTMQTIKSNPGYDAQ